MAKRYTLEEIEAGLHALAIANGNHRLAHRLLAEGGTDIPGETLRNWGKQHEPRYNEIRSTVLPEIRERMATESEALALAYAHIEREALEELAPKIKGLKAGELANVAKNVATSRGISVDKANVIRGLPTEITEHRHLDDQIALIAREFPELVIDSTAEEIPDNGKQIAKRSAPSGR